MAEPARQREEVEEWLGLATARSPLVGAAGAALAQKNCRSLQPGILETRAGLRPLFFNAPVGYQPPEPSSSSTSSSGSSTSADSSSSGGSSSADLGCKNTATVVLSNMENGTCAHCTDFNGTYLLTAYLDNGCGAGWQCLYHLTIPADQNPCEGGAGEVWLTCTSTQLVVDLYLGLGFSIQWKRTGSYTCPLFGTYDLPLVLGSDYCLAGGATCSVLF